MNLFTDRQGAVLVTVLLILLFLSVILFVSLKRSEAAFKLVKNRYWDGIVLDMAENGLEFERLMISKGKNVGPDSPHIREFGSFAGYSGSFESFSKRMTPDTHEITSVGKLLDRNGNSAFSLKICEKIHFGGGRWETIARTEQSVQYEEETAK